MTLLKKWLVEHKFRDWTTHGTDRSKKSRSVTTEEKRERAEEIAKSLGNNKLWHSHGRMIGPGTLNGPRLQIDDYSVDDRLPPLIRAYNDLLTEFIAKNGARHFLHSRSLF